MEAKAMAGGKYRVDRVIGQGGMGVVVAAHDVGLDRPVAIKFLNRASDREFAARFRREARAMAKVTNEHFVRVLDIGELPTGDPFLVMELLDGMDLAALVDKLGPLSIAEAADYVLQACEAIAEAHSFGIVHRDLKPSNMYLAAKTDGTATIKVLDFGIAKMASEDPEAPQSLTNTTAFLGSPAYMSPEQLLCARDVGVQADIWSLGAIMHKLLAGRPPFVAPTMPQVCSLIISSDPARVRDTRPEVPLALEAVILRCLQREPADRFGDVAELARALAPFAPSSALASVDRAWSTLRRNAPPDPSAPTLDTPALVSTEPTIPRREPWARHVALGAASVALATSAIAWLLSATNAPSRRTTAAATPPSVVAPPVVSVVAPAARSSPPDVPQEALAASSLPGAAPPGTTSTTAPAGASAHGPPPATPRRAPPRTPPLENPEFGGRK